MALVLPNLYWWSKVTHLLGKNYHRQLQKLDEIFRMHSESDFSRYVEKLILRVSQALIFQLAIFINLELLRISL